MPALAIGSDVERRAAISELISMCKYMNPGERAERSAGISQLADVRPPDNLMMQASQVRELHDAGMGVGAHTVSHPILSRVPPEVARSEIAASKDALEAIVRAPVTLFAYPNGKPGTDYRSEHVDIVRSLGFAAAVSTAWGAARSGADMFQLPRFTPWDRAPLKFAMRMLRNLRAPVSTAA
jgi:peptidoglycan/xylan/chitin deacetylase (PgdA/CDA1 family)